MPSARGRERGRRGKGRTERLGEVMRENRGSQERGRAASMSRSGGRMLESLTDIAQAEGPGGDGALGRLRGRFTGQADQLHVVIELNISFQLD